MCSEPLPNLESSSSGPLADPLTLDNPLPLHLQRVGCFPCQKPPHNLTLSLPQLEKGAGELRYRGGFGLASCSYLSREANMVCTKRVQTQVKKKPQTRVPLLSCPCAGGGLCCAGHLLLLGGADKIHRPLPPCRHRLLVPHARMRPLSPHHPGFYHFQSLLHSTTASFVSPKPSLSFAYR